MSLIQVENLHLQFAGKKEPALQNFSFSLEKGEVHAIIGGSGSGKSSFAFNLLNLSPEMHIESYQTYQLFGRDKKDFSEKDWVSLRGKRITLIPQNPVHSFHPYMSVGFQITDYLAQKENPIPKTQIAELLGSVGIKDPQKKLHSRPNSLSGGERQRLLIAMSFLLNPEIIIADEPTTALDSFNEKLTLKLLADQILQKNTSLILITHDKRLVRELADKVTVLKHGKIMETFPWKKGVNPDYKNEYTKKLLEDEREPDV